MKEPTFLTLAEVIDIHRNQIELYGGDLGLRDLKLLQSAIAQPEATFGGDWLHTDLFQMASAYAFHLANNHPFIDGNKRVALASALVFLELNDASLMDPSDKLYDAMMKVASGKMKKEALAELFRTLLREK